MLIATQNVPQKNFLTQKEVCTLSSLSRSTLERLERAHPPQMPVPRRFGLRCKRYPTADILQWLAGTWEPPAQQGVNHG